LCVSVPDGQISEQKSNSSMTAGLLPNVLIVGAPKCGTTSLHHYLDAHPSIAMSDVKELDFFADEENWARGIDWYRSNFLVDAPLRGESSTSYTRGAVADEVARRVAEVLGAPKIIYLVRDPIARIRSDYHQHRVVGVETRDIETALAEPDNRYVEASRYGSRIAPFIDQIGRENILVETQERLLGDRHGALGRIFRFLEVDDDVDNPEFERMWEQSEGKGWAYGLGWRVRQRGIRLPPALRWPAQRLQRSSLFGGAATTARPPELSTAARERLRIELAPEAERLVQLTGLPIDEWSI
jgi:Sulfotransferase domain